MKIVINGCYGGYGLSKAAYEELGLEWDDYGFEFIDQRDNPKLVACVEKLGAAASATHAQLYVVEIPDDVDWYISDYDGVESIEETHRSWC